MLIKLIIICCVHASFSAEPRPVILELEKHPVHHLNPIDLINTDLNSDKFETGASEHIAQIHYGKILQKPLAFSYFNEDDTNEKVLSKRENNEPTKLDGRLKPSSSDYEELIDDEEIINEDAVSDELNDKKLSTFDRESDDYEDDYKEIDDTAKIGSNEEIVAEEALENQDYDDDEITNDYQRTNPITFAENNTQKIDLKPKLIEIESNTNNSHLIKADLKASASDKKEQGTKSKDEKYEKGGGEKKDSEHHGKHAKKGDKGYKGNHKHHDVEKGHHNKEGHKGSYGDTSGNKKKHHHDDEYFGGHKKGDKGQKGAKYDEEGKHSKGHSTKGSHNIHKKDEYEKKVEFFDEFHEGDEHEKSGGYFNEKDHKKGGNSKKKHQSGGEHHDHYGKESKHEKGKHIKENKGHKKDDGHDQHHQHVDKYSKKGSKDGKKTWKINGGGGKKQGGHMKKGA